MKQLANIYAAGIIGTAIILQTDPSPFSAKIVTIALWPLVVPAAISKMSESEANQ